MANSPLTPVVPPATESASGHESSDSVQAWAESLAHGSVTRDEFLQGLADRLQQQFGAASVVLSAVDRSPKRTWTAEASWPAAVDPAAVNALLDTAGTMPIACDVPILPAASGESASADLIEFTRGLRVELLPSPHRTAVLVLYPLGASVPAADQIRDLAALNEYATTIRTLFPASPIKPRRNVAATPLTDACLSHQPSTINERRVLQLFHLNLNLQDTAYRIANESRRLLGCDRVTTLIPRRGRFRIAAVSGVAVVDRRSNSVRATESFTAAAIVMNRPLNVPDDPNLPPQLESPLDHYLDETDVSSALLLPLHATETHAESDHVDAADLDPFHRDGTPLGVMILESFSGSDPPMLTKETIVVATEAALALRNAREHSTLFGLPLWRALGRLRPTLGVPWGLLFCLLLLALPFAAAAIPVRHHVIATGTVEPSTRRQIFAAVDGTVKKVHVTDGQRVAAGDLLIEMESAELESQAESLTGQLQTVTRRLASVRALRLDAENNNPQTSRLALEERQLESEQSNLQTQLEIVRVQQQTLHLTSPIEGKVVGWQLARRLNTRPVSRGDRLASVVDDSDSWSLRLSVPDKDSGPLLEAHRRGDRLPVRFAVATDPDASFAAELTSISTAARLNERGQHVVDVTALVIDSTTPVADTDDKVERLDSFARDRVRSGADVTAKIDCGKRSLLRSWFGDVFDFVHRNVLFYFR